MEIIRGSKEYFGDIERLIGEFYEESLKEYGFALSYEALLNTMNELVNEAFFLIIDGRCEGVLAGKEVMTPLGGERIWNEIVWFVTEKHRKHGLHLLKTAQDTLKSEGYTKIVMVLMENSKAEKLSRFYERLGFQPLERHFIKSL